MAECSQKFKYFEDIQALKDLFKRSTPDEAIAEAKASLDEFDKVVLDIAITGESGAGKSSFVNAIMGLNDGDKGAAETGVTETTTEPTPYTHPKFPNVTLWDLPGIGTPSFKAKDYLKKVKFDQYDFFIIIASERFTENHTKLANEIEKKKKSFYFVRSKIDNDIRASEKKPNFNEPDMLEKIRQDCIDKLKKQKLKDPQVFLISSHELGKHDFSKLLETLEKELPEHKAHALVMSLPVSSLPMLERKKKVLEKQIWKLALVSASVAVIPVPGLSMACDIAILISNVAIYRKSFGLDDKSLQTLATRVNKPIELLKSARSSLLSGEVSAEAVKKMLASAACAAVMTLEYLLSNIPVVGSLAAGGISFATTRYFLKTTLDELEKDARNVLKLAFYE